MNEHDRKIFAARYEIIKKIGQGGMGEIYKVHDLSENRLAALKVVSSQRKTKREEIYARLKREARAIAKLDHPNIIKIYEFDEYQGVPYFTMEFIEGRNLYQVLRTQKKLSAQESAEILSKVADAMHYAHTQGIIHRDLSSGNIMLKNGNIPIIMDFGIAKVREATTQLTRDASIFGTLEYMPPERISDKFGKVSSKSDIYSMGMLLFEMLTGDLPFKGEKTHLIWQACYENAPRLRSIDRNIPKHLDKLCAQALQKEKKMRPKSALEFRNELLRFLRSQNLTTKIHFSHMKRLSKKVYVTIFAVIIALLLFLGRSFVGEIKPPQNWQQVLDTCWKDYYLDFTQPAWEKLAFHKKLEFSKQYQLWFAKKYSLPLKKKITQNDCSFSMVLIPPGKYWMGSLEIDGHTGQRREKIVVAKPFYISQFEVTRQQWYAVTGERDLPLSHIGDNCAVSHVSWYDIRVKFLSKLGENFQLPSEAQWEYTCRSGSDTKFFWGKDENEIKRYAWYRYNAYHQNAKHPQLVGQKMPNNWDVYDMSGNVYEWCNNLYDPKKQDRYAIRGGYWAEHATDCQSTARHWRFRDDRDDDVGFRFIEQLK